MSASRSSAHEEGKDGTYTEYSPRMSAPQTPARRSTNAEMSEQQKLEARQRKFGIAQKGEDPGLITSRRPSAANSGSNVNPPGMSSIPGTARGDLASRITPGDGGIDQALNMMQNLPPSTATPTRTSLPSMMSGVQQVGTASEGPGSQSGIVGTAPPGSDASRRVVRTGKWKAKDWYHFKRGDAVKYFMVQEEQDCDPPRYADDKTLVPRAGLVDLIPNQQVTAFVKSRWGIVVEVHVTHVVLLPLNTYDESGLAKRPRYQHYQFANIRFERDLAYQKQNISIPDEWTLNIADIPRFTWRPDELAVCRLATPMIKHLDTRMRVVGRLTPDSRNRLSIMYVRSRVIGTMPSRYRPWAAADNPWLLGMDALPAFQMPSKRQRDAASGMDVDYPGDSDDPLYAEYVGKLRTSDPLSNPAIEAIRVKRNDALQNIGDTHTPWVTASETLTVARNVAMIAHEMVYTEENRYSDKAPGTYDTLTRMNRLKSLRSNRDIAEERFEQATEIFTTLQKETNKAWNAFHKHDKELQDAEVTARGGSSDEAAPESKFSGDDEGQSGAAKRRRVR